MSNIKTLILDIETSLMLVPTFSLWPKYIPHDSIVQDWHIICAAWKWLGQKKVHGAVTYNRDDKNVVEKLRAAIIEADEIVYHNGRKFDYKKLNTRVILNGLKPMNKPKEIDTLIQAKRHFAFTSNRLDYIGQVLVGDKKLDTGKNLWQRVLMGEKKAVNEMYKYNKQDVLLLEKVYLAMKSHIEPGVNKNVNHRYGDVCAHCGSTKLHFQKYRYTKVCKYRCYVCQDCHAWTTGGRKENKNGAVHRSCL